MDEVIVSKAIAESFTEELIDSLDIDVAIAGAGPSGMTSGYFLAKKGAKVAIFERKLSIGGGMWGGGMMYNKIVVQDEGNAILEEFDVATHKYEENYWIANSLEAVSAICQKTIAAGARIFNLISMEDVMIRDGKVCGAVLNWSAVEWAKLHVDPMGIKSKVVIDATGHDSEIANVIVEKIGPNLTTRTGGVIGEKPMWAERGEEEIIKNTEEVYPGLIVTGMAANAVFGSPRMGPIFGGMLLSGKRAAELALEKI